MFSTIRCILLLVRRRLICISRICVLEITVVISDLFLIAGLGEGDQSLILSLLFNISFICSFIQADESFLVTFSRPSARTFISSISLSNFALSQIAHGRVIERSTSVSCYMKQIHAIDVNQCHQASDDVRERELKIDLIVVVNSTIYTNTLR